MRDERLKLRDGGLTWRRTGDEIVVLDLDRAEYLLANPTAVVVWEALAEGATREQLVARLCGGFHVDASRARDDVDQLIDQLRAGGLLET